MSAGSYITDLRLQNFRSYSDSSFELGNCVNIIVGPNASGKTNLLEAILVISRGKSYRARDADLIRFGESWARLDANMPRYRRTVKLETNDTIKKTHIIDNQTFSRLSHQRSLPVILFEPNHLLLLDGSPERRREFLDELITQLVPGFDSTRRHYKRALAQRNTLLKSNPAGLKEQLFVWNVRLSELGGRIASQRQNLINNINNQLGPTYSRLAGKDTDVQAEYISPLSSAGYESSLLEQLEQGLDRDILRGFTTYGPHRDDFAIRLNDHSVSETASRGEARSLVLSLKTIELGMLEQVRDQKPILLLDDVFSELDNKRRHALTELLQDHQTFITTTDADMVLRHFDGGNVIPTAG